MDCTTSLEEYVSVDDKMLIMDSCEMTEDE